MQFTLTDPQFYLEHFCNLYCEGPHHTEIFYMPPQADAEDRQRLLTAMGLRVVALRRAREGLTAPDNADLQYVDGYGYAVLPVDPTYDAWLVTFANAPDPEG